MPLHLDRPSPTVAGTALPPLAVGTMYFGTRVPTDRAHAVLDRAHDLGATFLDTANNYAFWEPGGTGDESELCLGRWLARRGPAARDAVLLATKVGARPARPGAGLDDVLGLAPAAVDAQVEGSLRRLGVDHVDLLYAHVDDPAVDPHETVGALQRLVDRGLARAFGVSNLPAPRLRAGLTAAAGGTRPAAAQYRFSYLLPRPGGDVVPHVLLDDDIAATCRAAGLLPVGYSTLLEGAYVRRDRPPHPAYAPWTAHEEALRVLDEVAAAAGLDAGQAVLSWMTQRPSPVHPLVGVSSPEQLDSAWRAVRTRLPPADVERLERARRR